MKTESLPRDVVRSEILGSLCILINETPYIIPARFDTGRKVPSLSPSRMLGLAADNVPSAES